MNPNDSTLPPVYRATLQAHELEAVLEDIQACGTQLQIQLKGGARDFASQAPADLRDVQEALQAGSAVQVRYGNAGENWCDTFVPGPEGTMLIRTQLPEDAP